MRNQNERRIRHVSQLKTRRRLKRKSNKVSLSDGIVKDRVTQKIYKEINDGNQTLYVELKTGKG